MKKRHFVVVERYSPQWSVWSCTPDRIQETRDIWSEEAISLVAEHRYLWVTRLHRWLIEKSNLKEISEWWAKVEAEEKEMFDAIDEMAELRKAALDHRGTP